MTVKFCKDCKHSFPDKSSPWMLRCQHPEVNKKDSWALGNTQFVGSDCRSEREKNWLDFSFFTAACGQKGKLFEKK